MARFHEVVDASVDPPQSVLVPFTPEEEAAADAAAVPTGAEVDAERDRRRYAPSLTVTVPSGTFAINTDLTAQANIQGLVSLGLYLSSTAPTQTTPFRDFANTMHDLTPADLIAMGLSVAAWVQDIYVKSWTLKAMSPIPADYTDDKYWQ